MLENIQIRPHDLYLGKLTAQVQTIKTVAGTSLGGKYILVHDASGGKHYFWFDTGSSVDPAPAGGWTGHAVAILVGDTASQVATKLQAVVDGLAAFVATVSGTVVTVTCAANGYAQPARDGEGVGATNFVFAVTVLGMVERKICCIQGDLEIGGFEEQTVDVKCHANGSTVQKKIVSGYSNPTLGFTMQELDKENIKLIMRDLGMTSFTPVGADKEEVFGYGTETLGKSKPRFPVRLHPVEKLDSDKSSDWTIWQGEMSLESILLAAEAVTTAPATLTMYPDNTKPKAISFYMIGDAVAAGY